MSPWIKQVCLVLAAVFMLSSTTESKKDEALYCSACTAIAEEMNYSVSQTDPKKTIHVGGFRLKPDGSLMDKKDDSDRQLGVCLAQEHNLDSDKL